MKLKLAMIAPLSLLALWPVWADGVHEVDPAEAAKVFGARCYEEASKKCGNLEDQPAQCSLGSCQTVGAPLLLGLPCWYHKTETQCSDDQTFTGCGSVWSLRKCTASDPPIEPK